MWFGLVLDEGTWDKFFDMYTFRRFKKINENAAKADDDTAEAEI